MYIQFANVQIKVYMLQHTHTYPLDLFFTDDISVRITFGSSMAQYFIEQDVPTGNNSLCSLLKAAVETNRVSTKRKRGEAITWKVNAQMTI